MPAKYPLCIDLDGTLLHSDLLLEAAFAQLKQAPLSVLCWPRWLAGELGVRDCALAAGRVAIAPIFPHLQ